MENNTSSHPGIFSSRKGILFLVLNDSCKASADSENVIKNFKKNVKGLALIFFSRFSLTFSDWPETLHESSRTKKSIPIELEKVLGRLEKIFSSSSLKIFGHHYQFWSGIIVLGNGRITLLKLLAKIFPALPALSRLIVPVHLFSGDGK